MIAKFQGLKTWQGVAPSPNLLSPNQLNSIYINEGGLNALIIKSKQACAVNFQIWLSEDVLPTLRRTGT